MARIFISYRSGDSPGAAGRLDGELSRIFGAEAVFRSPGRIEPGARWDDALRRALESCTILLVLIGPGWEAQQAQLAEPDDWVRQEIIAALTRQDVKLIPVLLEGARMPEARAMPRELQEFTSHQAFHLTDRHWENDVDALAGQIAKLPGFRRKQSESPVVRVRQNAVSIATWALPPVVLVVADLVGDPDGQQLGRVLAGGLGLAFAGSGLLAYPERPYPIWRRLLLGGALWAQETWLRTVVWVLTVILLGGTAAWSARPGARQVVHVSCHCADTLTVRSVLNRERSVECRGIVPVRLWRPLAGGSVGPKDGVRCSRGSGYRVPPVREPQSGEWVCSLGSPRRYGEARSGVFVRLRAGCDEWLHVSNFQEEAKRCEAGQDPRITVDARTYDRSTNIALRVPSRSKLFSGFRVTGQQGDPTFYVARGQLWAGCEGQLERGSPTSREAYRFHVDLVSDRPDKELRYGDSVKLRVDGGGVGCHGLRVVDGRLNCDASGETFVLEEPTPDVPTKTP